MTALRAVVFDVDGVLLDSATLHAAAWREAFDGCLAAWRSRTGAPPAPFDADREYRALVDGRSRIDGALAFLAARRIALPYGTPQDPPGCDTAHAVAARKDQIFTERLHRHGVRAFTDVRPVLTELRDQKVRCAAASASRHARELLRTADLDGLFGVLVDGEETARLALPGKPDPALFLEAAARLGDDPRETAVVEDALAGVEAGRRGHFGLVIGIARSGDPGAVAALMSGGAHLVLPGLARLPAVLREGPP